MYFYIFTSFSPKISLAETPHLTNLKGGGGGGPGPWSSSESVHAIYNFMSINFGTHILVTVI